MISIIFSKIKNNQKGGIEFIESSIIFPVILVFTTMLIILSLNTFYKLYTFEKVYKEGRKAFYVNEEKSMGNAFAVTDLFKKSDIISDLQINERKFDFKQNNNIFSSKLDYFENSKQYLSTSKMREEDNLRKLKFMENVYLDIKDLDSFKKLKSFTEVINNMKDNLMKKLNI